MAAKPKTARKRSLASTREGRTENGAEAKHSINSGVPNRWRGSRIDWLCVCVCVTSCRPSTYTSNSSSDSNRSWSFAMRSFRRPFLFCVLDTRTDTPDPVMIDPRRDVQWDSLPVCWAQRRRNQIPIKSRRRVMDHRIEGCSWFATLF